MQSSVHINAVSHHQARLSKGWGGHAHTHTAAAAAAAATTRILTLAVPVSQYDAGWTWQARRLGDRKSTVQLCDSVEPVCILHTRDEQCGASVVHCALRHDTCGGQ